MRLVLVLVLVQVVASYRMYQDRIPNGDQVPHPCKPNFIWRGVGHLNPLGGGNKNPFGQDYARYKQWSTELCRMDSDNDGLTNGQELGDPDCLWTPGSLPLRTSGITHPGVCTPWGSEKCREANQDISCDTGEFVCDSIHDEDVVNITLRFPPTAVPAQQTTYMCFTFELDMLEPGVSYHLIATQPYIDNANVMHHSSLSGCDANSRTLQTPQPCNMGACEMMFAVWTLGMPGECLHRDAGFKIGHNGITRVNMQHHWTNPELKTNYVDSSGMILYLTKNLRKHNMAYLAVGELHLVIPPGQNRVVETGTCSSESTNKILKGPVTLMTGLNHMHYLGYQQNVELFRNGMKVRDLTPDDVYSYDNPVIHQYDPLVELLPGDSLKTTCVYRSTSKKITTEFGDGTYDEMCFAVFTFYPAENLASDCLSWDDVELGLIDGGVIHGCDYTMMGNKSHPDRQRLITKVLDHCSPYGGCRTECPAALAQVREHPCFSGKLPDYTVSTMSKSPSLEDAKFLAALQSCDCSVSELSVYPSNGGHSSSATSGIMTLVFALLFY